MYGLAAINAYNGWELALVGISIVFTGLVALSVTIAQIHRLIEIWHKRNLFFQKIKRVFTGYKNHPDPLPQVDITPSLRESAKQFKLLANSLGDTFSLPRLLELAKISGISHPHSSLNNLIRIRLLIPDAKGFFIWNNRIYTHLFKE